MFINVSLSRKIIVFKLTLQTTTKYFLISLFVLSWLSTFFIGFLSSLSVFCMHSYTNTAEGRPFISIMWNTALKGAMSDTLILTCYSARQMEPTHPHSQSLLGFFLPEVTDCSSVQGDECRKNGKTSKEKLILCAGT